MNKTRGWYAEAEAAIRRSIDDGRTDDEIRQAMWAAGRYMPGEARDVVALIADVRRRYLGSGRPAGPTDAQVVVAYRRHGTKRGAARELGVSDTAIRKRLRGLGID